jgi:hypothetical protein
VCVLQCYFTVSIYVCVCVCTFVSLLKRRTGHQKKKKQNKMLSVGPLKARHAQNVELQSERGRALQL